MCTLLAALRKSFLYNSNKDFLPKHYSKKQFLVDLYIAIEDDPHAQYVLTNRPDDTPLTLLNFTMWCHTPQGIDFWLVLREEIDAKIQRCEAMLNPQ